MTARPGSSVAIDGYTADAASLVERYDALPCERWYAPVRHLIPAGPGRTVDIGAGTGRDARWFAALGHDVVAVEPVHAFRAFGATRGGSATWVDDRLPTLATLRGQRFDLLVLSAVWHHLDPGERAAAVPVLRALAAPGARVVLALRHGPGHAERPGYPVGPAETAASFGAHGFSERLRVAADAITPGNLAAGVTWTWLVMELPAPPAAFGHGPSSGARTAPP